MNYVVNNRELKNQDSTVGPIEARENKNGNPKIDSLDIARTLEIGIPPYSNEPETLDLAKESLPYVKLSAFKVNFPQRKKETELLPMIPDRSKPNLKIHYIPQSFTDSFSNSMTDSFLSSLFSGSSKVSQGLQLLGISSKKLGNFANSLKNSIIGKAEHFVNPTGSDNNNQTPIKANFLNSVAAAAAGNLYLFPKIWGGSNGLLQYTFRTRLISGNPNSTTDYTKNIIEPIKAILSYTLPVSTAKNFFQWPPFCRAISPGMFFIKKGMVTNVTIEKGVGNSISFNQRPSIIDVTITVSSVYDAVLQGSSDAAQTIDDYMYSLESRRGIQQISEYKNFQGFSNNVSEDHNTPTDSKSLSYMMNLSKNLSNYQVDSNQNLKDAKNQISDLKQNIDNFDNATKNFMELANDIVANPNIVKTNPTFSNNLTTKYLHMKQEKSELDASSAKLQTSIDKSIKSATSLAYALHNPDGSAKTKGVEQSIKVISTETNKTQTDLQQTANEVMNNANNIVVNTNNNISSDQLSDNTNQSVNNIDQNRNNLQNNKSQLNTLSTNIGNLQNFASNQ